MPFLLQSEKPLDVHQYFEFNQHRDNARYFSMASPLMLLQSSDVTREKACCSPDCSLRHVVNALSDNALNVAAGVEWELT